MNFKKGERVQISFEGKEYSATVIGTTRNSPCFRVLIDGTATPEIYHRKFLRSVDHVARNENKPRTAAESGIKNRDLTKEGDPLGRGSSSRPLAREASDGR